MPTTLPVTLQTPAGPVSVSVETTEDKVGVHEAMDVAVQLAEVLGATAEGLAARHGVEITCGKGCGACCRQLVPVSPIEAFALVDAIADLPSEKQQRIQERLEETREHLVSSGLSERIRSIRPGPEGRATVLAYFAERLPCPMLEDDVCQVYARRPFACRDLLVASDPAHCDEPGSGQVRRIPVLLDMGRAVRSVSAAVYDEAPLQMPLAEGVAWAEDNADLRGSRARGIDLAKGLVSALVAQTRR